MVSKRLAIVTVYHHSLGLTFHEVVQVAVVGAMILDGIPGLRDGHSL